jgi:hypothetical protein
MGLYEALAARPGGESMLAAARLRRRIEVLLYEAGVEVPRRRFRRALTTAQLGELLFAAGYELDLMLVPAGEYRRQATEPGQSYAGPAF